MPDRVVTLPLHCPTCGKPMMMALEGSKAGEASGQAVVTQIACPRPDCRGTITPTLYGRVIAVWVGKDSAPNNSD